VLHKAVVNLAAGVGENWAENPGRSLSGKTVKKGGPKAAV
jgi:hypothetical protein